MGAGGWQARLASKVVTADEALRAVHPGDRVFVHGAAAAPTELLDALARRAGQLAGGRITALHTDAPAPSVTPGTGRGLPREARFVWADVPETARAGRADHLPIALAAIPHLFRSGALPLDVTLLNLSPPDANGYCSLGTSVGVALEAARSAPTVIALLNTAMSRTRGDASVHADQLTFAVLADRPPVAVPVPPTDEVAARIGALV